MGYDQEHNHEPIPDFNRMLMLIAIVSLSLALILIFALHFYARLVIRRHARLRAALNQLSSLTVAHGHDQNNEPHDNGLDPLLIEALPMFIFKQKQQPHHQEETQNQGDEDVVSMEDCAVCLSALENEEMVRLLPNCKHTFHVGCIDIWLASHSTCPICRTKVEPRLVPHPREAPNGMVHVHVLAPMAPLLIEPIEGTSDGTNSNNATILFGSPKINGSNSRLSSFRIQPSSHDEIDQDLERQ